MKDESPPAMPERVDTPEGWLEIYSTSSQGRSAESAYVLTALGIEHQLVNIDAQWTLWVPLAQAPQADRELREYWSETGLVHQRPALSPDIDSGWLGAGG
jgi:hypothetical protein